MAIKIKHTDPTLNEFSTKDIVVNVQSGSLFFKSNTDLFKVQGDNLSSDKISGSITSFDGVLGIGTSTPSLSTEIYSSTTSPPVGVQINTDTEALRIISSVGGNTHIGYDNSSTSGGNYFSYAETGNTYFRTYDGSTYSNKLFISGSGKVGIGTAAPAYKLDLGESSSTFRLVSENNGTAIRIGSGGGSNDVTLLRVDGLTGAHDGETNDASSGFSIKYLGGNSLINNSLTVFADNVTSSAQIRSLEMYQNGVVYANAGLAATDNKPGNEDTFSSGNRSVVTYYNTATSGSLHSGNTGAIVISDIPNHNIMYKIKINGYVYKQGKGAFEIVLGGYWYPQEHAGAGSQTWYNTSAYINGTDCPYQKVRFAYESANKPVIIIGETDTSSNPYTAIGIEVMQSYAHTRATPRWKITQKVTDLSAYTIQRTRQFPVFITGTDVTANAAGDASGQDEGTFNVRGAISKGSGTFKIDHPDPLKTNTHYLQHSFVESPTGGDNVYRWNVTTVNKMYTIKLPDYYKFLNKDDMVWISPVNHFGRAYRTVNQEQTEVNIIADTDGIYNVLLVGTRKDPTVLRHFEGVEIKK